MRKGWILLALLLAGPTAGTAQVPTPVSHFGFEIGADRQLADWEELTAYYERVARASPRVRLDTLGVSTRGRPFVMLTVTSPENQARLEELRAINQRLADPRTIASEAELRSLIDAGRTVVLVTNHVHSFEVGSGQVPARVLYRLATSDEPRIREILDNVIVLNVPSLSPDGTQLVADWWRRWVGTPFEGAPLPELYHKYVGHDLNRDWYAFTQIEAELTVRHAHNAWRPQIVQDHHQLWDDNLRIWIPPYTDPFEPNVDPLLIGALNQAGKYIAAEMLSEGKTGVGTYSIFDAFTPGRAYQHHHGGVRILVETARANWAAPVEMPRERLVARRGADPLTSSWNHPAPWSGGTWRLGDIVDYMESATFALLTNAARNREFWLSNFHRVNQRAVDRWESWPTAWVIPAEQENPQGLQALLRILRIGDVEVHRAEQPFTTAGRQFAAGSYVIPMNQPFASFAQALLEVQEYPDLREYPGGPPQRPYDVTAHTLPLLKNVDAVAADGPVDVRLSAVIPEPTVEFDAPGLTGPGAPRIGMFKGFNESMPAGWTRWVFDRNGIAVDTLQNADILRGGLIDRYDVIVFQDQSPETIRNGWSSEVMPEPYAGGLGDAGMAELRRFVEAGGRIVAIETATDLFIDSFGLPVRNAVVGLDAREFFVPGSILRLDLDATHPVAAGLPAQTIAWVRSDGGQRTSGRAFEVQDNGQVRVIGRYGAGNPLLSGWILGPQHLAERPALVEASLGQGSVVLFGFQPNYRGQSMATWPLLFNAMNHRVE